MKQINFTSGVKLGPYVQAEVVEDGVLTDRGMLPFTVYGSAEIVDVPSLPAGRQWGHWAHDGDSWVLTQEGEEAVAAALLADQRRVIEGIDSDVDFIRRLVIGDRGTEYAEALRQAREFAANDFEGTAPAYVASWTVAKSVDAWTDQQAAEDIIATGELWLGAEGAIRAQRLLRKEQVRKATSQAELGAVKASWAGFVTYMKTQLGIQ